MYTHSHTGLLWLFRPVQRKATMVAPPPRSGHIGLRVIVCVLSTSKIRRKVSPNVWLWDLCAEWAPGTGDSIMALAWENSTIVLETLMALAGSVWAGLSSSLRLPQTMTLTAHCLRLSAWPADQRPLLLHVWIPTNRKHLDILWPSAAPNMEPFEGIATFPGDT